MSSDDNKSERIADTEPAPAPRGVSPRVTRPEDRQMHERIRARLFGGRAKKIMIGPYEVVEKIGAGGMGIVYRVVDPTTGTALALKTGRSSQPEELWRLKQEFRNRVGLVHPNLLRLNDLVIDGDTFYVTMELLDDAVDFMTWVRAGSDGLGRRGGAGELPTERVRELAGQEVIEGGLGGAALAGGESRLRDGLAQLARGLVALHDAGTVHRDIKPDNVLVTREGRVVLLDFGLAAEAARTGTRERVEIVGTVPYMAPEQTLGAPTSGASDLYAVGVMLYEALVGHRPHRGTVNEIFAAKQSRPPTPPSDLVPGAPEDLSRLASSLLQIEADARPTARGLLDQLDPGASIVRPRGELPFVGRARELAQLERALATVANGRAAVLTLRGPSGIGKSTLVRRWLSLLDRAHVGLAVRVFQGRCHPLELIPYKALDQIIDALARCVTEGVSAGEPAPVPVGLHALTRLFPSFERVFAAPAAPAPADVQELRKAGFEAVVELLAWVSRRGALVLWIDDAQWGDLDSALLLESLLRGPVRVPALLVLSGRDDGFEHSPLLRHLQRVIDELAGETIAHNEILLGRLADAEISALFESRSSSEAPASATARVQALVRQCEGNPFLASELFALRASEPELDDGALPTDIDGLIMRRVALLSPRQRALLEHVTLATTKIDRDLVLEALGGTPLDLGELAELHDLNLLRSVTDRLGAVAPYHGRVREAVVRNMSPGTLRTRHRALARSYERRDSAEDEALLVHWEGAGEPRRAGEHALRAGERSSRGLAFARAADLYSRALELLGDGDHRRPVVLEKLGASQINLGLGSTAARTLLSAEAAWRGRVGVEARRIGLRRRAAEQLLRFGHMEEGWSVMSAVLRELNVQPSRVRAIRLLRTNARRLRFMLSPRPEARAKREPPSQRARLRLEALWSASTSLSMSSPTLADAFRTMYLLEAQTLENASMRCRAYAYEASMEAFLGGEMFATRVDKLLETVREMASSTGDPYDEAWHQLAVTSVMHSRGRWSAALTAGQRAEELFRTRCLGAYWERSATVAFVHAALAFRGEFVELRARLEEFERDARRRGDPSDAIACYVNHHVLAWLAIDRAEQVRARAREAFSSAPVKRVGGLSESYLIWDLARLVSTVHTELYCGEPDVAWAAVLEHWPGLRASFLLSLHFTRVEARQTRARAALALASTLSTDRAADAKTGWTRARLLADVRAQLRFLDRERNPVAAGWAALARAGLEAIEGRHGRVSEALEIAEGEFVVLGSGLYLAVTRFARAALLVANARARAITSARAWFDERGVLHPERFVAALAPGVSGGV